jgi:hypothetical protein
MKPRCGTPIEPRRSLELAQLRRLPVRVLMKQMGIKARPIHG